MTKRGTTAMSCKYQAAGITNDAVCMTSPSQFRRKKKSKGKTTASPMTMEKLKDVLECKKVNRTCSRSTPKVAEPNLVGSSPFSARS